MFQTFMCSLKVNKLGKSGQIKEIETTTSMFFRSTSAHIFA
jgi:hypothetical protein